jgi:hypothetical protein
MAIEGERKSVELISEKVNAFERSMQQRLPTEVNWYEAATLPYPATCSKTPRVWAREKWNGRL